MSEKYFKKIVGKRVYLSPINKEDINEYTKWLNDFKVTDGIGASSRLYTLSSEKEWIEETSKKSSFQFAIVSLQSDQLLGNCGFNKIDHIRRCATIGIFIGEEKKRGLGYGTDAIELLLDYGFNYLNLNNIMLKVFSFNENAIAVYKKVGFKEIGRRRKSYFLNGKYYDEIYMDILQEEFKGNYIINKNV